MVLNEIRSGSKFKYTGDTFKYCPWCGLKIGQEGETTELGDEFSKKIGGRVRLARFLLNKLGSGIIFGWKFAFQVHGISLNFEQQNRRPSPKPFAGEGVSGMGFEVFLEICSLFGAAKG